MIFSELICAFGLGISLLFPIIIEFSSARSFGKLQKQQEKLKYERVKSKLDAIDKMHEILSKEMKGYIDIINLYFNDRFPVSDGDE